MLEELAIPILIAIGIIAYIIYKKGKRALIEEKKRAYIDALKRKDKQAALFAGRDYYAELRGGKLSVFDEQTISNDLNALL
jgi:hypothetical protein